MFYDPRIIKGDAVLIDEDDGQPVSKVELVACYREYVDMLVYVNDLERGIFHMTAEEYRNMPAPLADVMFEYRKFFAQKHEEELENARKAGR